jgi:hypothetical protein
VPVFFFFKFELELEIISGYHIILHNKYATNGKLNKTTATSEEYPVSVILHTQIRISEIHTHIAYPYSKLQIIARIFHFPLNVA